MRPSNTIIAIFLLILLTIAPQTVGSMEKSRDHLMRLRLNRKLGSRVDVCRDKQVVALSTTTTFTNIDRKRAKNLLILCSIIYSLSYIFTKKLVYVYSLEVVNIIRFGLGSMALLPAAIFREKLEKTLILAGIELGLWCSIGYLAQAKTIRQESTSKAALFSTIAVVIPPLLDGLVIPDKGRKNISSRSTWEIFRGSKLFPAAVAFLGAVIVECGELKLPTLADSYLFISPIAFALCFWRSEQFHQQYHFSPTALTAFMLLFTCGFLMIYSLYNGTITFRLDSLPCAMASRENLFHVALLVFNGFLATAFNSVAEQNALQIVSAADLSLTYAMEPIFTAVLSLLILSEPISWNLVIGAFFIVFAAITGTASASTSSTS